MYEFYIVDCIKMVNEIDPQNVEKQRVSKTNPCKDEISGALRRANPELFWNVEAILKDLKKNHVKEYDAEEMWYKWKRVHIDLPAVWNFDWFEFDYFVSENTIKRREFKENPEFEKESHSFSSISKLLEKLNKYMKELGVETDWNMDYRAALMYYYTDCNNCVVWNYLKDITGLDSRYRVHGSTGWLRVGCWRCSDGYCGFGRDMQESHLFLR